MDEVLGKYKRIQGITLVYRILVISLQFVKCYDVPDSEEDECGGEQQRQHVAEGRERERHGQGGAGGRAGASGERQRTALWVKPFTSPGRSHDRRRGLLPARLRTGLSEQAPSDGRSLRRTSDGIAVNLSFILWFIL